MNRRHWLTAAGASLTSLWLAGCDRLASNSTFTGVLRVAEKWTQRAQRLITDRNALAQEFAPAAFSRVRRSLMAWAPRPRRRSGR